MTLSIGTQIQNAISIAFKAQQPVMLRGGTGVGKSEIIEQVCKDLGIEYIMRDLSIMEPSDLVGIPQIAQGRTQFAPPVFLPSGGKGIMMFEELNRAPGYMLAPMLELLTARRLNDYRVPDGWLMVAAVNPDDNDAYNGTRQMDAALLARFMVLNVKASVPNWVAWAKTQNIDPRVIDFVKSTPKIFDTIQSNPRAWTKVSKVLKEGEQATWNKELAISFLPNNAHICATKALLGRNEMGVSGAWSR